MITLPEFRKIKVGDKIRLVKNYSEFLTVNKVYEIVRGYKEFCSEGNKMVAIRDTIAGIKHYMGFDFFNEHCILISREQPKEFGIVKFCKRWYK